MHDAADGVVWFIRRASVHDANDAVDLKIGTDWSQLKAVAQEVAARTRNMLIGNVSIWCVGCASPLIAFWRDAFDDCMPCRNVELSMSSSCSLNKDIDLRQLFQPFAGSKIGVTRYEIAVFNRASNEEEMVEFDALWSAWDRSMAQVAAFDLHSMDLWSHFLEKMLREPEHGIRHYTLEGEGDSYEEMEMVQNYMQ
ncbi:hypothetical protein AAVH_37187, partial [Aphelenchoides avenae]